MVRQASLLLAVALASCADPPPPKVAASPSKSAPPAAVAAPEPIPTSEQIPVTADDPTRGPRSAPVTIVVFSDFECPFCSRVEPTLAKLLARYPGKLRVVWKDLPLPFHKHAREAAVLGRVIQLARGEDAFWQFHDKVFANQAQLADELSRWAAELGVDEGTVQAYRPQAEARVEQSLAESRRLDIRGTPNFLIDGESLAGAQPLDAFVAIVDAHLQKAAELAARGVAPSEVYPTMVKAYWEAPKPQAEPAAEPEDLTVWKVEVGRAPAKGPTDAPVTIVTFSDFQCPFCKRIEPTLDALDKAYPGKLRFVWKNQPLAFHKRAMPAAIAAWEVYKQKGAGAFFKMHDALFASQPKLEDDDLVAAAQSIAGVDLAKVRDAVAKERWRAEIEEDAEQAEALKVGGTPHTFVNGRAVPGARPLEFFKKLVDAELAKAEARLKAGTPAAKLYEATIADGKFLGAIDLPVPPDAPWKGGAKAKVVVQVFSDFQCPFCRRLARPSPDDDDAGALAKVEKKYGDKIKIVWREFPLSFHPFAVPAAHLAREAKKKLGNAGFWKAHDALFDAPSLDDAGLQAVAQRLGLDGKKIADAIAQQAWKDVIDADLKAGQAAGVQGTPAVFVNGKAIAGAQSFEVYAKAIDKALARAK